MGYLTGSEKMVSRKPLGSLTSKARLFHSVSCGSDVSVMPAIFARAAISSTLPGVEQKEGVDPPDERRRQRVQQEQKQIDPLDAPGAGVHDRSRRLPAQAGMSDPIVQTKPVGSITSNARLFHSVSRGSDLSVIPAPLARFAISSTFCVVDMNNRMPIPFVRSRPFFQSS